jgi:GntR family transcriptional regulator, gluconate operon transcriptional repressor
VARPRKPRVELALGSPLGDRRQLWQGVASGIRDAILSGALPAGSSLVEADLAERFAVSRGPVRDALRELAREGLVADLPRRGSVVSTLTSADIREVYAVREGLETVAARLAIAQASDAEIELIAIHVDRMEEAWDRGAEYAESLAEDLGFHRGLVALSGNDRLNAVHEQMLSQTQLLVRTAAMANPTLAGAMQRSAHRDIQEAILARDIDRARLAIADHYAYAVERLFMGLKTVEMPAQISGVLELPS